MTLSQNEYFLIVIGYDIADLRFGFLLWNSNRIFVCLNVSSKLLRLRLFFAVLNNIYRM